MTETTTKMLWMVLIVVLPMLPALGIFKWAQSKGSAGGTLYGVDFKFGGAAAGYAGVFLVLFLMRPTETSHLKTWKVLGRVSAEVSRGKSEPNLNDVVIRFAPPQLGVMNDGFLSLDIPVVEDATGRRYFPDLLLNLRDYRGVTIPLGKERQYGVQPYKITYNEKERIIVIEENIVLKQSLLTAADLAEVSGVAVAGLP